MRAFAMPSPDSPDEHDRAIPDVTLSAPIDQIETQPLVLPAEMPDASLPLPSPEVPDVVDVPASQMSGTLIQYDRSSLPSLPRPVEASLGYWLQRWAREHAAEAREARRQAAGIEPNLLMMEAQLNDYEADYLALQVCPGRTAWQQHDYEYLTRTIPSLAAEISHWRGRYQQWLSQAQEHEQAAAQCRRAAASAEQDERERRQQKGW